MNIILMSGNLRKVRTVSLSRLQTSALTVVAGVAMFFASGWAYTQLFGARGPSTSIVALAEKAVNTLRHPGGNDQQHGQRMREEINALTLKLGEMQAQLLRLDAVGQRLARSAGLNAAEFRFDQTPARGGAAASTQELSPRSMSDVGFEAQQLARLIDDRHDKLEVIDALMMSERIKEKKMPTITPVAIGYRSSGFGYRNDPFNGTRTMHEGLDFVAAPGTPVVAAAAGVVSVSEMQSDYGNIIEIDHGNGLSTRYAHLSKRLVNVGDVVFKGNTIAEVGSTGRSTGPHLHFEVRNNGQPVDPNKFLEKDS